MVYIIIRLYIYIKHVVIFSCTVIRTEYFVPIVIIVLETEVITTTETLQLLHIPKIILIRTILDRLYSSINEKSKPV